MTKDEALKLEALKYAASMGYGRIVREMKIAPFTIKCNEALAQPEQPAPQHPWVGLTDDEVYRIAFALEGEHWRKVADAIEAKLKEKNT